MFRQFWPYTRGDRLLLAGVALITVSACEGKTARRKAVCLKPEPAAPAETRHAA